MAETLVSKSASLEEGNRVVVSVGNEEVGVFRYQGRLYAYSNTCLHSGGPACEGLIIAKVEERIREDKTSAGLFFSKTDKHFVCPWHGYEYDLRTGEYVGDRSLKLRSYQVVEKDGGIYVVTK